MTRGPGVVIVGAGIAGLTLVETLRTDGYDGAITWIGAESHLPYSRPALSKQVLTGSRSAPALIDEYRLADWDVVCRLGVPASRLDLASHRIGVGDDWVAYHSLVIATGLTARRPTGIPGGDGVRVLRTLDDAHVLAKELGAARRVAILGTGVLGCEIASAAHSLGVAVEMVGRGPGVSLRSFGGHIERRVARLLDDAGIRLHRAAAAGLDSGTVMLGDGSKIESDLVVAALGSLPATDWLVGSGLDATDGIRCDENGRAVDGVYAIGDVARWADPVSGAAIRSEHQASAIEQARIVASSILGTPAPDRSGLVLWTELFGQRVQAQGVFPDSGALEAFAGDMEGERFVARHACNGVVTGIVGWNMPREFRVARETLVDTRVREYAA